MFNRNVYWILLASNLLNLCNQANPGNAEQQRWQQKNTFTWRWHKWARSRYYPSTYSPKMEQIPLSESFNTQDYAQTMFRLQGHWRKRLNQSNRQPITKKPQRAVLDTDFPPRQLRFHNNRSYLWLQRQRNRHRTFLDTTFPSMEPTLSFQMLEDEEDGKKIEFRNNKRHRTFLDTSFPAMEPTLSLQSLEDDHGIGKRFKFHMNKSNILERQKNRRRNYLDTTFPIMEPTLSFPMFDDDKKVGKRFQFRSNRSYNLERYRNRPRTFLDTTFLAMEPTLSIQSLEDGGFGKRRLPDTNRRRTEAPPFYNFNTTQGKKSLMFRNARLFQRVYPSTYPTKLERQYPKIKTLKTQDRNLNLKPKPQILPFRQNVPPIHALKVKENHNRKPKIKPDHVPLIQALKIKESQDRKPNIQQEHPRRRKVYQNREHMDPLALIQTINKRMQTFQKSLPWNLPGKFHGTQRRTAMPHSLHGPLWDAAIKALFIPSTHSIYSPPQSFKNRPTESVLLQNYNTTMRQKKQPFDFETGDFGIFEDADHAGEEPDGYAKGERVLKRADMDFYRFLLLQSSDTADMMKKWKPTRRNAHYFKMFHTRCMGVKDICVEACLTVLTKVCAAFRCKPQVKILVKKRCHECKLSKIHKFPRQLLTKLDFWKSREKWDIFTNRSFEYFFYPEALKAYYAKGGPDKYDSHGADGAGGRPAGIGGGKGKLVPGGGIFDKGGLAGIFGPDGIFGPGGIAGPGGIFGPGGFGGAAHGAGGPGGGGGSFGSSGIFAPGGGPHGALYGHGDIFAPGGMFGDVYGGGGFPGNIYGGGAGGEGGGRPQYDPFSRTKKYTTPKPTTPRDSWSWWTTSSEETSDYFYYDIYATVSSGSSTVPDEYNDTSESYTNEITWPTTTPTPTTTTKSKKKTTTKGKKTTSTKPTTTEPPTIVYVSLTETTVESTPIDWHKFWPTVLY